MNSSSCEEINEGYNLNEVMCDNYILLMMEDYYKMIVVKLKEKLIEVGYGEELI